MRGDTGGSMHQLDSDAVRAIYEADGLVLLSPPSLVMNDAEYQRVLAKLGDMGRDDTVALVRLHTITMEPQRPPSIERDRPVAYVNRAARRAAERAQRGADR